MLKNVNMLNSKIIKKKNKATVYIIDEDFESILVP